MTSIVQSGVTGRRSRTAPVLAFLALGSAVQAWAPKERWFSSKLRCPSHLFLLFLASWFLLHATASISKNSQAATAEEYAFEVEGDLRTTFYREAHVIAETQYRFTVSVSGHKWYLATVDDQQKGTDGTPIYRHLFAGSEGEDTYMYSFLSKQPDRPPSFSGTNACQGSVTRGNVPELTMQPWFLWTVFASSHFLDQQPERLRPPFVVGRDNLKAGMAVTVERFEAVPGLPRIITFYNRSDPTPRTEHTLGTAQAITDATVAAQYLVLATT